MSEAKHTFISGVSSGIGEALLRLLVKNGHRVSGVARREERLEVLREEFGDSVCLIQTDVCDQQQLKNALSQAFEKFGSFDGICANAGGSDDGEFSSFSQERVERITQLNYHSVVSLTQLSRPMWAKPCRMAIVSSIVAYIPVPFMGPYSAAKHAVQIFAETLRMEEDPSEFQVCTCNPGPVATEFFDAANERAQGKSWTLRPSKRLSPDTVARCLRKQLEYGAPARAILPWRLRFLAVFYRLFPSTYAFICCKIIAAQK